MYLYVLGANYGNCGYAEEAQTDWLFMGAYRGSGPLPRVTMWANVGPSVGPLPVHLFGHRRYLYKLLAALSCPYLVSS